MDQTQVNMDQTQAPTVTRAHVCCPWRRRARTTQDMMTGLPRGRMSALRDLGFYQVLEPVEVGGDEPLRPAAQQAGGQPERAAGRGPDRLGEERRRSVRGKAVLLLEADRPGDADAGQTARRLIAGHLIW